MEITKPRDRIARQEVRVGDATTISRFKRAVNADLTFMDPPYNIGIDYGPFDHLNDKLPVEVYLDRVRGWIHAAVLTLRPGGVLAVLISEEHASAYDMILAGDKRLSKMSRIIWHERFAQYSDRRFTNEHRHLFLYRRVGDGDHIWNTENEDVRVESARMKAGDKRAKGPRVPGDVWDCPRLPGNATARVPWHPCQLHPAPLRRLVAVFTDEFGKVCELFSGSGSLAVVCKAMNRNYNGIDSNKKFVESTRKIIERYEHYERP